MDQHGAPHALVGGEPLPLNSRCYSWLRRLMWEHEERAVNGEYLKTAAGTLAAHAEFSGDVLDRSLVVELERIPDGERRTEEELRERFEAEHPKLLGALFGVLAEAIARKPSIKLSRRPRLADWGEYAAAVYEVMGWGSEQFLEDWSEVVKVQNQATLDGSPVAQAIIKFMEDRDEYTATSSEMHSKLKVVAAQLGVDVDRDKAWPKSARWLWRRIKEVLPLLVAAGIEATYERPESGTRIALRKVPKSNASNASVGERRSDKGKAAGISAVLNASSNASENSAEEAASGNTGNRNWSFWENDPMRAYRQEQEGPT